MTSIQKTVFVVGAGFTRAFLPDAPLLTDNYDIDKDKFKKFKYASHILESELSRNSNGKIDIERLMTRLYGQMPYDSEQANKELDLLLSEVKKSFMRRLNKAKSGNLYEIELADFASHCVNNHISCITFNYDDIFDRALWEVEKLTQIKGETPDYWHPDGGYGFFCIPSESCVGAGFRYSLDFTAMLLLKLHGSVNWRVKRGYLPPYSIDAIVHQEQWLPSSKSLPPDNQAIESHLEKEPFIVPPILIKSALVEQPILKLIWSQAYRILNEAERITFVGYSLPVTDIAVSFLFRESIQNECEICVVNLQKDKEGEEQIRKAYQKVFPKNDVKFKFEGALEWSSKMMSNDS